MLVAPFNLRSKFITLVNREIKHAKAGKPAEIFIKMNNLVDIDIIEKLYQASRAGVKIKLIIRGICSLVPGIAGVSENIEAISIVDKFLEHNRVLVFYNLGKQDTYIGSADLMTRNLDHRIEIVLPILDEKVKKQLLQIMDLQWQDNVKARIFDATQSNVLKTKTPKEKALRSQDAIYDFWQDAKKKKK